jgi:hypothetical protein
LSKWKFIEMNITGRWKCVLCEIRQIGCQNKLVSFCSFWQHAFVIAPSTTKTFNSFRIYLHLLFYCSPVVLLRDDIFWNTIINHLTYQVDELDAPSIRLGPWEFGLLWNQRTYSLNKLQIKSPDYNRCCKCCWLFCTPIGHPLDACIHILKFLKNKENLPSCTFSHSIIWEFDL